MECERCKRWTELEETLKRELDIQIGHHREEYNEPAAASLEFIRGLVFRGEDGA